MSGANICLLEYLQILQQKGFQNYLICPHEGGAMATRAGELGIPVYCIKHYSWARHLYAPKEHLIARLRRSLRNVIASRQIADLIKKLQPAYVVTNTITTPVAARAARATHTKHVWMVHEFGEEDHGFTIAGSFTKGATIMNRLSAKIVFNSKAVAEKYQAFVPKDKQYFVNNAVMVPEVEIEAYKQNDQLKLILLGQLAPSKNHLEALQAVKICSNNGVNISLSITGKPENMAYHQSLLAFIQNEGLLECIHFTGQVAQPAMVLSQHQALLMCSHREAFGRVTVEALKCGLPVIAANTGGSLEIIEEAVNGYFYKAGDAADLAGKILLLYENYQLFNRLAIAKHAREKYNEINTGLQLLEVFR